MSETEIVQGAAAAAGYEVHAGRIEPGMTEALAPASAYSWGDPGEQQELRFTGSGREYFRIWIVNLCLTIATLGIYSAWAKVRRLQYFDRNTQLGGAVFNFHGDPLKILRGRVIAALLLFCYHYLFGLNKAFSLTLAAALMLGMPLLLRSALRFRLRNTSYRGLRFDFRGSVAGAYLNYLPVVLMLVLPGLLLALNPHQPVRVLWSGLLYVSWPWLHARIKRYQHGQFSYGALRAHCDLPVSAFAWAYIGAALAMFGVMVAAGLTAGFAVAAFKAFWPEAAEQVFSSQIWITLATGLATAFFGYLAYLACGPLLQVKIWNRTWSATCLPGVSLNSSLPWWPYLRLQVKNTVLTLLTLGLYRPFAVVNTYQFRLAHVGVHSHGFDRIRCAEDGQAEHAAGEGAADFLGFDVSW